MPPVPTVPRNISNGFTFEGFGPELALDICKNSLPLFGESVTAGLMGLTFQSQQAAMAEALMVSVGNGFLTVQHPTGSA